MHDSGKQQIEKIRGWARELGFDAVGIAGIDLGDAASGLDAWLAAGKHGDMNYMARHGSKRCTPDELVPGTRSVISVRMNYLPDAAEQAAVLADTGKAYVSRYALGRDYHKLLRQRLQQMVERMQAEWGEFAHRVFTDSAPVMEVEIASRAGIGWRGKHTLLLDRSAGSWFFLGEIFSSLELPEDQPATDHCGTCTACLQSCPTEAFDGPYRLDARRCISYLTIELKGAIPPNLRSAMGNRIYGCDDCQLACPWNRFAMPTREEDFQPRNRLDAAQLVDLFAWTEDEFNARLAGSPIRRIGHESWLRNIAVALGNGPSNAEVLSALRARVDYPSELVGEHVAWALVRLTGQI